MRAELRSDVVVAMTVFLIRWFVDGQQVRSLIWKMLHVVGVAFWKVVGSVGAFWAYVSTLHIVGP
jgi:hypothetical protein